jgi:Protein of unknown function (DUF2905)
MSETEHVLVILGLAAVPLGAAAPVADRLRGRLPGDARLDAGSLRIDFPFATSLLIAAVAAVLLNLLAHH